MTGGRGYLPRIRARLHRDERGFTMVEVIAAILIFSVIFAGIASMQSSTLNLIRSNRHRSVAANLASEEMDRVRSTTFTALPIGQVVNTRTVDSVAYTVTRDSEWVASGADAGACDAPAGSDPEYLRVNVLVTWATMRGVLPVTSQTVVTPPVGTYDANTGHLAVSVLDRNGAPVGGIQVSLSGPQSESRFTTSDGCVFFGFLPAGSYTASVSSAGYVSDQGVAVPSQPSAVVAGAISSLQFQYDRAATLNLTLVGKDTGAAPPLYTPLMLANTHLLPAGQRVYYASGTGAPFNVTNLFPFNEGYEAWAGSCTDAYPGAGAVSVFAVTPGGTTTATIPMPEVKVVVTVAGVPAPGELIQVVHAATAGCPGGEYYWLGYTDALGQMTFALPYGVNWWIFVGNPAVLSATITLAPTDPPGPKLVTVAK